MRAFTRASTFVQRTKWAEASKASGQLGLLKTSGGLLADAMIMEGTMIRMVVIKLKQSILNGYKTAEKNSPLSDSAARSAPGKFTQRGKDSKKNTFQTLRLCLLCAFA